MLGRRVSKAQRLSNWEAATLTDKQQLYAATDAWVCTRIYDRLQRVPKNRFAKKTGFFVDQRENRALLEHYAKGRTVLNMFCYTGGFSVYAMRGGASQVHSVDSSAKAVELTNANVALNFPPEDHRHEAFCEDAFKYLDSHDDKYEPNTAKP